MANGANRDLVPLHRSDRASLARRLRLEARESIVAVHDRSSRDEETFRVFKEVRRRPIETTALKGPCFNLTNLCFLDFILKYNRELFGVFQVDQGLFVEMILLLLQLGKFRRD